jgi:hypothetical protein
MELCFLRQRMSLLSRQSIVVLTPRDNNEPSSRFSVASVDAAGRDCELLVLQIIQK